MQTRSVIIFVRIELPSVLTYGCLFLATNSHRAEEAEKNKVAEAKSLDDEILAKRIENQRLEEERMELERTLNEKRKEADALKVTTSAVTAASLPIISLEHEDGYMGRAEEGIAGFPTTGTIVRHMYSEGGSI